MTIRKPFRPSQLLLLLCFVLAGLEPPSHLLGQPPPSIRKLSDHRYKIGSILIDNQKKELSVPGKVNLVSPLEFVACASEGSKMYECALGLETNAMGFNLALIVMGLDPERGVPARHYFDVVPPQGDPVEISVEWEAAGKTRKIRAEELLFNDQTKKTMAPGPWVYTASSYHQSSHRAAMEGVLIGFVHTPSSIIDKPSPEGTAEYGTFRFNPDLALTDKTPVTLIIRALPSEPGSGDSAP